MLSVLTAFARASFRQQAAYRVANAAGLATNAMFLAFRVAALSACYGHRDVIGGFSPADATTFAVVTQATLMVAPVWGTLGLANDVRTGQIAVELLRPVDPYAVALARRLGASLWFAGGRMVPLLLVGAALGALSPPEDLLAALVFLPSLAMSAVVGTSLLFLIELSAFWLESERGVRMVVTGVAGVASGLLLPLSWYPPAVATALAWSPWAAVLDAPARIWVGVSPQELVRTLVLQAGWVVAVALLTRLVLARATRHLQIAGG
ncbi:MAG: ABC-2 family transporter protein [Alphaproteobacteria bacterium]|nr:ABC-2 family transporter protein [Alphaproteobacteria bacterium]MCB9698099.1 ABC-2 family transporter protein [Alphaproteobacteria bacterium]